MIQTVQLALADAAYAAAVREALTRSAPWHIVSVARPDVRRNGVLVLDEDAFHSLPLPLPNPECVVLVTPKDPQHLSAAWDAGVVSVVSVEDPLDTVLLAIMAAALRLPKSNAAVVGGAISPNPPQSAGPISPEIRPHPHKRPRT